MDGDDENEDPASRHWNTWLIRIAWSIAGALVFICLIAAARQATSRGNRLWYDVILDGFFPLLGAAFIIRWIVSFPFRFFELFAGVVAAAATAANTYAFWRFAYQIKTNEPPRAAQLAMCLFMADVVLLGLGSGLRNCSRLNVQTAWKRLATVCFGIAQGPAVIYFGLPLFLLSMDIHTWTDDRLWRAGALWFLAAVILAVNAQLAVKALQLKAESP